MKHLDIPCLPALDGMRYDQDIVAALDAGGARGHIDQKPWPQYPYAPLAAFNAAHSGTALYIDFFVRCNYLRAVNTADQSPVSQDSCVEFFVSPDPSNPALYHNFEFNCIGAVNSSFRTRRDKPTRLTSETLARIVRSGSCGTRPFLEMEGIFNWNLTVRIPFDVMGIAPDAKMPLTLRANFYKVASAASTPHFLTWNPMTSDNPDFHRPQDFGTITLL